MKYLLAGVYYPATCDHDCQPSGSRLVHVDIVPVQHPPLRRSPPGSNSFSFCVSDTDFFSSDHDKFSSVSFGAGFILEIAQFPSGILCSWVRKFDV